MAKTEFRKKLEQYSKEYVAMCESHKECSGCPYKDADQCYVRFMFDKDVLTKQTLETELEKNRWIPVAERLPDVWENDVFGYKLSKHVLCQEKGTNLCYIGIFEQYVDEDITRWSDSDGFSFDVVAWMPLPEPYKEEGAE